MLNDIELKRVAMRHLVTLYATGRSQAFRLGRWRKAAVETRPLMQLTKLFIGLWFRSIYIYNKRG